ncbi:MAG TPA: general secretion pathway protein GspB [Methylomirabilota bacterium]|jgi:hypothetical protein
MSYILDALRKAERDRQTTPVPTIDAVHAPFLVERTIRFWPWLVAGALAVNVVVLVAVFRPRGVDVPTPTVPAPMVAAPAGPATAQAVAPTTPVERAAPSSAPAPATAPATAPSRVAAGDGPAVTQAPRATETDATPAAPPRIVNPPVVAAVPKTHQPAHEAEPSPRAEAPKADSAEPTKRQAPASRPGDAVAAPTAPRVRVDEAPAKRSDGAAPGAPAAPAPPAAGARRTEATAPGLQDLPASFRESAPKLRLEVLLYSDAPAERMVFINGRKYREGDTVEGKAVVESIVRDGAVLSYQGQRYLLRE